MENRPLRLITSSPVDALARTLEALLVVASAPLSVEDLAVASDDDEARVEQAVAFLALLELCKAGEIAVSQAAAFAPIRVSRADDERILQWRTVRSA